VLSEQVDQQSRVTGRKLLENLRGLENHCESLTLSLLDGGQLGKRTTVIYAALGDGLSLLAEAGSCQWGCRGENHAVENLLRRCSNYATASLRLAFCGYYDEAIGAIRGLAEIANLMQLFSHDGRHFSDWQNLSPKERKKQFAPVAVRKMLIDAHLSLACDSELYSAFCELGVHVTPETLATSHHEGGRVFFGPDFSVMGLCLVFNELALTLAPCIDAARILLNPRGENAERLSQAGKALALSGTDWLRVTNYLEKVAEIQRDSKRWYGQLLERFSKPVVDIVSGDGKKVAAVIATHLFVATLDGSEDSEVTRICEICDAKGDVEFASALREQYAKCMRPSISNEEWQELRLMKHGYLATCFANSSPDCGRADAPDAGGTS